MLPVTYSHVLITLLITCLVHASDHKTKLPVRLNKLTPVSTSEDLKAESSNEEILQISESVIDATYQQAKDLISERRKRENLDGKCLLCSLSFKFDCFSFWIARLRLSVVRKRKPNWSFGVIWLIVIDYEWVKTFKRTWMDVANLQKNLKLDRRSEIEIVSNFRYKRVSQKNWTIYPNAPVEKQPQEFIGWKGLKSCNWTHRSTFENFWTEKHLKRSAKLSRMAFKILHNEVISFLKGPLHLTNSSKSNKSVSLWRSGLSRHI